MDDFVQQNDESKDSGIEEAAHLAGGLAAASIIHQKRTVLSSKIRVVYVLGRYSTTDAKVSPGLSALQSWVTASSVLGAPTYYAIHQQCRDKYGEAS